MFHLYKYNTIVLHHLFRVSIQIVEALKQLDIV